MRDYEESVIWEYIWEGEGECRIEGGREGREKEGEGKVNRSVELREKRRENGKGIANTRGRIVRKGRE